MRSQHFTFHSATTQTIFVHKWFPESKPKAILVISHGMAEHSARYENFAQFLCNNNFGVYAHDHAGHGKTADSIKNIGFFDYSNGWFKVTEDLKELIKIAKKENPDTKIFLLGHSMGSLLARTYICFYSNQINGVILSGTSGTSGIMIYFGKIIAWLSGSFCGAKVPSPFLDKLSFGTFNKKIIKPKTKFDWLSTDEIEVEKYIKDPLCGTVFSNRFFYDMLTGITFLNNRKNSSEISKNLPIFMFSGETDPVGEYSIGFEKVYKNFIRLGIKNLEKKIYKGKRHEMLNETNRIEVFNDILMWLNKQL